MPVRFFLRRRRKRFKNPAQPVVPAACLGMYVVSGSDQQKRLANNR
jgi:hypothetical protein